VTYVFVTNYVVENIFVTKFSGRNLLEGGGSVEFERSNQYQRMT